MTTNKAIFIFYAGFKHRRGGAYNHVESMSRYLNSIPLEHKVITLDSLPTYVRYLPHIVEKCINFFCLGLGYYYKDRLTGFLYSYFFRNARYAIYEDVISASNKIENSVVICHALWSDNLQGKNVQQGNLARLKKREAAKLEDTICPVLTVSEPYRNYICNEHFGRKLNKILEVIHLGINIKDFQFFREEAQGSGQSMVFCGSLEPRKNLIFLLGVLKEVNQTHDFELTIIGDGPQRSELEAFSKKHSLRVVFSGRLNRTEVYEVFRKSNIYIHTSTKESFSMSLLEAKLCGLTTVAFADLQVPQEFIDVKVPSFTKNEWVEAITNASSGTKIEENKFDEILLCQKTLSYLGFNR